MAVPVIRAAVLINPKSCFPALGKPDGSFGDKDAEKWPHSAAMGFPHPTDSHDYDKPAQRRVWRWNERSTGMFHAAAWPAQLRQVFCRCRTACPRCSLRRRFGCVVVCQDWAPTARIA